MSKLNLHWQGTCSWMRRVRFDAPYVKLVDPPEDNIFPDKRTIGRVYMRDGDEGSYYSRGTEGGDDYFRHCLGRYLRAPHIYAWESWNEPAMIHTPEERAALCAATGEWARLMHDYGWRICVGNFSERNPPDGTIAEFAPMLEAADYLGLHCYEAPRLDSHGYVLRYRQLIGELRQAGVRVPPILIGECGVDGGVIGMGRKGWQRMPGLDWGEYLQDLCWLDLELQKDEQVAGAFLYTAGASKDWQTFNISEKHARDLAKRLA
jgi:hypothetical protein